MKTATFLTLAALLAVAVVPSVSAQDPPPAFARVCSKCHDGTRIIEGRRLRSQWEETLEKMVALGAAGTDEDFEAVLDYLVRAHGRVNVNTAAADEIGLVLHLDANQSGAIVKYREEHGKFADFEALTKVPGIPIEGLKKVRDAILF
jgi:competence ComEA-like helix-hairpin-helix protein